MTFQPYDLILFQELLVLCENASLGVSIHWDQNERNWWAEIHSRVPSQCFEAEPQSLRNVLNQCLSHICGLS